MNVGDFSCSVPHFIQYVRNRTHNQPPSCHATLWWQHLHPIFKKMCEGERRRGSRDSDDGDGETAGADISWTWVVEPEKEVTPTPCHFQKPALRTVSIKPGFVGDLGVKRWWERQARKLPLFRYISTLDNFLGIRQYAKNTPQQFLKVTEGV